MYVPGTTTGTLAALNAVVEVETNNADNILFQITGTWSGTATFESSVNGTDWHTQSCRKSDENNANQLHQTSNSNVLAFLQNNGCPRFRVRMSTYTSGTATVTFVSHRVAK